MDDDIGDVDSLLPRQGYYCWKAFFAEFFALLNIALCHSSILLFGKAWSQKKFGVILEHIEELHAFVEDQFCIFFFQDLDCFYMVAFNSYLYYSVYMCPNFRDFHFNLVDSLPYKWNWILHKF